VVCAMPSRLVGWPDKEMSQSLRGRARRVGWAKQSPQGPRHQPQRHEGLGRSRTRRVLYM
jgi:hypothetical protein